MTKTGMGILIVLSVIAVPVARAADAPQSPRLERAKDLIADEHWTQAIEHLRGAATDPKEKHRDEAMFWLAHSQHQARDLAAALHTIVQLERRFPSSRWVKPARSLRIEIAQKLRRDDVLWLTAQPEARAREMTRRSSVPRAPRPPKPPALREPAELPPPGAWIPENWEPDTTLQIQALGSLMQRDPARVIPILKDIALQSDDPREARRAVFVLAQSGKPEAHRSVLEVARQGPEPVQLAAVKELGRFGGPAVTQQLLEVYAAGKPRVRYEIVNALGDRAAAGALLRIVETEMDRRIQETAIIRLGQVGGREQLQRFYARAGNNLKRPVIVGLFNARADEELIRIAESERDQAIRGEALMRLRLLGTPRARAYLDRERLR